MIKIMKTIAAIQQDIRDITYKIQNTELKKGEEKRLRKRIPFLKTCIMYLESEPKKEFVKKEIERIDTSIDRRMAEFVLNDTDLDKKTANLKTYNTNLKANIKTINTNAIANVKTLNTNA